MLATNRIISWRRDRNRNDSEMLAEAYEALAQLQRLVPNPFTGTE